MRIPFIKAHIPCFAQNILLETFSQSKRPIRRHVSLKLYIQGSSSLVIPSSFRGFYISGETHLGKVRLFRRFGQFYLNSFVISEI